MDYKKKYEEILDINLRLKDILQEHQIMLKTNHSIIELYRNQIAALRRESVIPSIMEKLEHDENQKDVRKDSTCTNNCDVATKLQQMDGCDTPESVSSTH